MRERDGLRQAIEELQALLKESPADVRTHLKLGDLFLRVQEPRHALGHFEAVAAAFEAEGAFLKAVAVRRQMLRVEPRHLPSLAAIAELSLKLGLTADASDQFRLLANHHLDSGRAHDAMAALKRGLDAVPSDLPLQVALAEGYVATGNTRAALSLMAVVAQRLRQEARWELYEDVLHRIRHLGGDELDVARGLAESALRQGRREEAAVLIRPLMRHGAGHPRTHQLLRELLHDASANEDQELPRPAQ